MPARDDLAVVRVVCCSDFVVVAPLVVVDDAEGCLALVVLVVGWRPTTMHELKLCIPGFPGHTPP